MIVCLACPRCGGLEWGDLMYYSAGAASPAAFGAAVALPHAGALWHIARLMLDCAGGLFGIYLLTALGLSLTGRLMRVRDNVAAPGSRSQK